MLEIPTLTRADLVLGNIDHMPRFKDLPEDFQRERGPFCDAVQRWFFSGAEALPNGVKINGVAFTAKPGVDANKALMAIKAALCSFEPKHEHKIAGCGFMLAEWFDIAPGSGDAA